MKKTILILFAFIAFSIHAQITKPYHKKALLEIKNKKMAYFVSPGGINNKDFADIITKYWTMTPFKIITADEIKKNLSPESLFFTDVTNTLSEFNGANAHISSFGYLMWSPSQKMLDINKESTKFDFRHLEQFYEIKIEGDYWYTGFFKNFLQQIQNNVKTINAIGKADIEDVADPSKIAELKNNILYVPNYILKKDEKAEEMFSKYSNKYQMISSQELNKKIMAGENIYYMLTCIYGQNCKIINVVNSQTGQLVYSSYEIKPIYPYLRKNDIGAIDKEIAKAGK